MIMKTLNLMAIILKILGTSRARLPKQQQLLSKKRPQKTQVFMLHREQLVVMLVNCHYQYHNTDVLMNFPFFVACR